LLFSPGIKTAYSSTNYELLALVLEKNTGIKYGDYVKQAILHPNHLEHTFVNGMVDFPDYGSIENAYIDRYSDKKIKNFTDFEKHKIAYLTGSDGVLATMHDYFSFYRLLFSDRIVQPEHLDEIWKIMQ
jgi:CubicO group peptidase (beta-lactamase class C family)